MCQCLCSETRGDVRIKLGDAFVTVDAYMGCDECDTTVGIDVRAFTADSVAGWGLGNFQEATPDPDGGPNGGTLASYPIFNADDLAEAATLLGLRVDPDYENWSDFFSEWAVKLMKGAHTCCQIRMKKEEGEG